jgi:hypothetical protein
MVAESSLKPDLEIATNTVLADVLASVSDTVKRLEMPLATPLDPGKVKSFQTGPVLAAVPSSLRSILKYEGGYEFGHQDSIVYELRTPDSYKGRRDRESCRRCTTVPAPVSPRSNGHFRGSVTRIWLCWTMSPGSGALSIGATVARLAGS